MTKFILVLIALSVIAIVVNGSSWMSSFISAPSSSYTMKYRSYTLSMSGKSSVMEGKQKKINLVKERYSGRGDIAGMVDNDEDLSSYDLFAEADSEEVDPPKIGQTITGIVVELDDNGALVEIGGKMSGFLPVKEASLSAIKHVNTVLELGQTVTAEVVGTLKGTPVISLRSAQLIVAWEKILVLRSNDETFDVEVLEVNKGGAVCDCLGLKAFLPGSHFQGLADESLIGKKLRVKFLDINEDEGKLVVSQRRAMSESNTVQLKRGEVVSGTITGLRNYGAFLELDGGVAGLLHISQISYGRVENPETLFTIGQRAKVMILDFDKTNGRVALSTKSLEPSPGDMLRDMNAVFAKAEETAKKYHERLEAERLAREAAAKDIVAGLGGAIADATNGSDPLLSVADSIESILASVVSDVNKGL